MADGESLELRSVVQRFGEATDALDQLRMRLRSLELAEEVQHESAAALRTTAATLAEYTAEAAKVVEELRAAGGTVQEAMAAAVRFLEGTDLAGLVAEVAAAGTELRELRTTMASQARAVAALPVDVEVVLARQVETWRVAADEQTNAFRALRDTVEGRITDLTAQLDVARQESTLRAAELAAKSDEVERLSAELRSLEAKVARLPERARKKAGIEH